MTITKDIQREGVKDSKLSKLSPGVQPTLCPSFLHQKDLRLSSYLIQQRKWDRARASVPCTPKDFQGTERGFRKDYSLGMKGREHVCVCVCVCVVRREGVTSVA